jgi:hypothetical protein
VNEEGAVGYIWTDNAANSSTRIRAIHINELRTAVNQLRAACNLAPYNWTDNPIGTSTYVRAVRFTELRTAIQDLWNCHTMGALPNWSVGSTPSASRQVSARDVNDLRGWVDQVDPPRALNGLHWQSPVDLTSTGSRTQVNAGTGFGSVLILSPQDSTGSWNPATDPTTTQLYWLERNRTCNPSGLIVNEVSIVRLYWTMASMGQLPANPVDLATKWQAFITWCQGQGIYNFIVLNELDAEYNGAGTPPASPSLWQPTNPTYMSNLADAIRQQNPNGPVYLGFPGPSALIDVNTPNWNTYWGDYASTITNHFNNISIHAYGTSLQALKDRCSSQATNLRSWFPAFPQRVTEYGIPISSYPGGNTPQNHNQRGSDYASFVNWVRSGWTDYIFACHAFIGRDSPAFGSGTAADYEMSDSEAAALANGVGCVGQ